jgi:hypothetical protein
MSIKVDNNIVIYDDRTFKITNSQPSQAEDNMLAYSESEKNYQIYRQNQWSSFIRPGSTRDDLPDATLFSYKTLSSPYVKLDGSVLLQSTNQALFQKVGLNFDKQVSDYAWTAIAGGITGGANVATVIFANNLFVAAGGSGTSGDAWLVTSTNGITWTARTSGSGNNLKCAAYGAGVYLAAGTGGRLITSTDAVTWTARSSGTARDLYSAVYANGTFVIGGTDGEIRSSTDGITWTARSSATARIINGLAYAQGTFVLVGNNGELRTTTDITQTFTGKTSGTTTDILSITYGNGIFVYTTRGGRIGTSTDAVTWKNSASGVTNNIFCISYDSRVFVVGATAGRMFTSTDALTWQEKVSGSSNVINGIAYGKGSFIRVGDGGNAGFMSRYTYNPETEFALPVYKITGSYPDTLLPPVDLYYGYRKI